MFSNLHEFIKRFSTEQRCIDHLRHIRWPEDVKCPFCGEGKAYEFKDRRNFKCRKCKKRFSVRVGTIFQSSQIPLQSWFLAIYLIASHKKGYASTQLARDIGVTQKTAMYQGGFHSRR